MAKKVTKKTHKTQKTTANWVIPAVITVLVGVAVMWCWGKRDLDNVQKQEEGVLIRQEKAVDGGPAVEGATTSDEIDSMFKRLDDTTSSDDLSDLEQ